MERELRLSREREDRRSSLRAQSEEPEASGRGHLFFKQFIAAAVIIAACILLNRSGIEFIKNCMAALGRAVRWELDIGAIGSAVSDIWSGIVTFFSETLPFK